MSSTQKISIKRATFSQYSSRFKIEVGKRRTNSRICNVDIHENSRKYICCIPQEDKHAFNFILYKSMLWYIKDYNVRSETDIINDGLEDFSIRGFQLDPKEAIKHLQLHGHLASVTTLSSSKNMMISCDLSGMIIIWDLDTCSIFKRLSFKLYILF
jgi:WD40 repeat protein